MEIYEYEITKHITLKAIRLRSGANAIKNKGNFVLYLDKELVEKLKELGFKLSKTFENHLKHLMDILQYQCKTTLIQVNTKLVWWGRRNLNPRL
jgi:hypothetical protein